MTMTLKAARVNANLTQKEAADKMGIHVAKLRRWEDGSTSVKVEDIPKIENTYNIKYADIDFSMEIEST